MKEETVLYLSDKEEEIVSILTKVGTQKNVAKILIFLANTAHATSRMMERGLDLRQPEVSVALKRMAGLGWVKSSEIRSERVGRSNKRFALAMPVREILSSIEKATIERADNQIALVRKIRSFA